MIQRYIPGMGAGAPAPPSNPLLVLTVSLNSEGTPPDFQYSLSRAVDADIVINRIVADNFITCGDRAQGSIQRTSGYTIPAGTVDSDVFPPDLDSGVFSGDKYTVNRVRINGTSVTNGGTIVVGGFTVDIQLQQCS